MSRPAGFTLNGTDLIADTSGALYWPEGETLVVSDLHLEKGSSLAQRGHLLPPYDSDATLARLEAVVCAYAPRRLICLGDSFHDGEAHRRLPQGTQSRLTRLMRRREWIWICGNHDPAPPEIWGGQAATELTLGPLSFRHEARRDRPGAGEVSGHFHPTASVRVRQKRLTARCFATDGRRLIVPAFGAFAGGLDVLEPVISDLFSTDLTVHMLGRRRVHSFPRGALVARRFNAPR